MGDLHKVMTIDDDGLIIPKFPYVNETQENRSVNWFLYMRECDRLGKKPCAKEFAFRLWENTDEGPRAS